MPTPRSKRAEHHGRNEHKRGSCRNTLKSGSEAHRWPPSLDEVKANKNNVARKRIQCGNAASGMDAMVN
jgi:hypothetical protein